MTITQPGKIHMVMQRIVKALIQNQQYALDRGNPPFAAIIECDDEILMSAANESRTTGNPSVMQKCWQ